VNPNPAHDFNPDERDGLVLGVELVLATVIFAFLGWLLDGAVGTTPLFTTFFGAFTCAYEIWKIVTNYDAHMAEHDAKRNPLRQGPVE
jgi:F0F1-type ATP synthase assembly protein I